MDKKQIYAIIVGVILFAVGIALRTANQEGLQIILSFIIPLVVGAVATGVKRGFLLGSTLFLLFSIASIAFFSPENLQAAASDASVAMAVILFSFVVPALIGGALGAIGGFIGKRLFK